jgi:hypothetical protein
VWCYRFPPLLFGCGPIVLAVDDGDIHSPSFVSLRPLSDHLHTSSIMNISYRRPSSLPLSITYMHSDSCIVILISTTYPTHCWQSQTLVVPANLADPFFSVKRLDFHTRRPEFSRMYMRRRGPTEIVTPTIQHTLNSYKHDHFPGWLQTLPKLISCSVTISM